MTSHSSGTHSSNTPGDGLPQIEEKREVKVEHSLKLGRVNIIDILRTAGYPIPITAQVFVTVSGGGDWSNSQLDINGDHPLELCWTTMVQSAS